MIKENSKVQTKFKGGGSIVSLPPVFSEDAQFIYVAWKNHIISYSTKTTKRICEFKGLRHRIIGFGYFNANGDKYIAACTNKGKVAIWKDNNGLKLKELRLKLNENVQVKYFKVFIEKNEDFIGARALVCFENLSTNTYEFSLLNLDSGQLEQQHLKLKNSNKTSRIFVDASGNGKYFIAVCGRNMYYSPFGTKYIKHSIKGRIFTCVACHPEEVAVLTGDNTGRILLWHNITTKNPSQAIYHWHTLPTETICFSTSGTYFYSGGSECVLVKWDQTDNNFKNFLPRLPAPIKYISLATDNILIAVATEDNGIQIISPQLKIVNVIQHLVLGNDTSAGIKFDSRSKSLILNGVIGHVQLFSSKDMNLTYSLDVVGQNKYTNERDKNIINTVVTKVAIDSTGLWMATVECRCDPEMFECRLKFWFFDSTKQNFSLNTSIEYPHEKPIKDIVFQSSVNEFKLSCVTVGDDQKFKVWEVVEVSTVYHQGHSWRCSGDITYKDLNPQVATFSSDGSLIAVGFESVITIWLSDIHELKCSLRQPNQDDNLIHLSFGNGTECHLLFSATSMYVSVWNLLSLTMLWTVRVDISLAISDPSTSFKALFTKDKKIFIVDLKSANPVYSSSKLLKDVGDVHAAVFVPKAFINTDIGLTWYRRLCIYFLDSNYELFSIDSEDDTTHFDFHIDETSTSLYTHLLPKIKTGVTTKSNVTHMYQKGNISEKFHKFLDTPAHTMPPLHLTCEGILQAMILENQYDKPQFSGDNVENSEEQEKDVKESKISEGEAVLCEDLSKIRKESTAWISVF